MEVSGINIRYTLLGIVSAVIYSMRLSDLLDKISSFVFLVCLFVVGAMILYAYWDKSYVGQEITGELPGHDPDMKPKTTLVFRKAKKQRSDKYCWQALYLGRHSTDILKGTSIAIVGLGNIGRLTAELFARAGVGRILLFDDGIVHPKDKTYDFSHQGSSRAAACEEELQRINSEVVLRGHNVKLSKDNMQLIDTSIVLDCTDDFYTKLKLNKYCLANDMDYFLATSVIKRVNNDSECIECFTRDKRVKMTSPDVLLGSALAFTEVLKSIFGKSDYRLITYGTGSITAYSIPKDKLCSVCEFRN